MSESLLSAVVALLLPGVVFWKLRVRQQRRCSCQLGVAEEQKAGRNPPDGRSEQEVDPLKNYKMTDALAAFVKSSRAGNWVYSYNPGVEAESAGRAPNKVGQFASLHETLT
jgi:hypothetical protein